MYDNWCIEIGNRLYDPLSKITYLILSENRGSFYCLKYKDNDKTYIPNYTYMNRDSFYTMFHLLPGNDLEQTINSPKFRDINFYITQSSLSTEDILQTFKFYPTEEEVKKLFESLTYIKDCKINSEKLVENKRVIIDSTFIIEIKEY